MANKATYQINVTGDEARAILQLANQRWDELFDKSVFPDPTDDDKHERYHLRYQMENLIREVNEDERPVTVRDLDNVTKQIFEAINGPITNVIGDNNTVNLNTTDLAPTADEYGLPVDPAHNEALKQVAKEDYETVERDVLEALWSGAIDDSDPRAMDPYMLKEVFLNLFEQYHPEQADSVRDRIDFEPGENPFGDEPSPSDEDVTKA